MATIIRARRVVYVVTCYRLSGGATCSPEPVRLLLQRHAN